MASVTQFAQFLLNNEPQKNAGRLALYHFLKNFGWLNETFDENILKEFYFRAFLHEYWCKNKQALELSVKECVSQFVSQQGLKHIFSQDQGLSSLQTLTIDSQEEFIKALRVYLQWQIQSVQTGQELLSVQPLEDSKRALCLIKNKDASIEVLIFKEHFSIMEGHLVPLSPMTHLKYNAQLELKTSELQKIEVSPHLTYLWKVKKGAFQGYGVKGYTFQKCHEFQVSELSDVNLLFLSVKKVESQFLDLSSDPYYTEIVRLVEKSMEYLESKDKAAILFAENTLKKAQYVLKSVFPHDKLLSLLVSNLEYSLIKSKLSKKDEKRLWPKNQRDLQ